MSTGASTGAQQRISGYGVGAPSIKLNPPPIISPNAPSTTNYRYPLGQTWIDTTTLAVYTLVSNAGNSATWVTSGGGSSEVSTINGLSPVAGNIVIAGTAAQIGVTNAGNTVTLALLGPYTPATYTAHGVLVGEGASPIVATAAGTDGQVLTGNSAADPAFAAIGTKSGLTAHGIVLAEGTGAFVATAVGATGQGLMGSTGADPGWTGSPSFSGSVTAGTTLTASAGNITATNGNLVLADVGNKLVIAATASATCSAGTFVLGGGATTVVSNSAVTANSIILLTTQALGTVTVASTLSVVVSTPGVNFTVTPSQSTDTSTVAYLIIN